MKPIIVVGVDRSDTSRAAAIRAAEIAKALDGRLHVVTAVEPGSTIDVSVGSETYHSDWVSRAEELLADVIRTLPHDDVTGKVTQGDAAKALCAEAEALDAEAIVVGNRRVQGLGRVLGSVASDVARMAPCDVVIANTAGKRTTRSSQGTAATSM